MPGFNTYAVQSVGIPDAYTPPDGDWNVTGAVTATGAVTGSDLHATNLTGTGQIALVGASGKIVSDADLSYNSTTNVLTVGGAIISPTVGPVSTQQHTLPAVTSDTVALLSATQTLSAKTLASPTVTGLLYLEGTTAAFPAIKRSTTKVSFRLGDDSADAGILAGEVQASGGIKIDATRGLGAVFYKTVDPASTSYAVGVTVIATYAPAAGYKSIAPAFWTLPASGASTAPKIRFTFSDGSTVVRTASEKRADVSFGKDGLTITQIEFIADNTGAAAEVVDFGIFAVEGDQF